MKGTNMRARRSTVFLHLAITIIAGILFYFAIKQIPVKNSQSNYVNSVTSYTPNTTVSSSPTDKSKVTINIAGPELGTIVFGGLLLYGLKKIFDDAYPYAKSIMKKLCASLCHIIRACINKFKR